MEYEIGVCRFCGQAIQLLDPAGTQGEADIYATEQCDCWQAKRERDTVQRIENAKNNIRQAFGEEAEEAGFGTRAAKEVIQLLDHIAELIGRGYIGSATVSIGNGCRAKIALTSKDNIKVERSEARSIQLE